MRSVNIRDIKQVQLVQLKALTERACIASERYARATREETHKALNHATLHGEHWRAEILVQTIRKAEKCLSLAIDGTERIETRALSMYCGERELDRLWECVFWNSYSYANACTLDAAIEEMRQRIVANGGPYDIYDAANVQIRVLKTKTEALRNSWRMSGVPEALIAEIANQLRQLSSSQIEFKILRPEQTWERGLSVLTVSVEEYENLVERYGQTVEKIVAGLSAQEQD